MANPVAPASLRALKDMGACLQTLKRFQVSTDLTAERVRVDDQKLSRRAVYERLNELATSRGATWSRGADPRS
jgi:hypothetical protein